MSTIFAKRLLAWFDEHGRKNLPWQQNITPYRVWISEIMLQQTQVATVIPYYERFMKAFPNIQALASAPLDRVLHLWSGLGYYARARNLHQAAQRIQEEHAGQFPQEYDQVVALPGIGRSTAGAILAISTQQAFPILDGNVKRILCRHEALEAVPNTQDALEVLWDLAARYTPKTRVHHYTQAIMDLGATLCTRSKPDCPRCPLKKSCQAYRQYPDPSVFPRKAAKKEKPVVERYFLLLQNEQGALFFYQRPSPGIWGGLWSLPEFDTTFSMKALAQRCEKTWGIVFSPKSVQILKTLPSLKHSFSHYHLHLKPLQIKTCHHQPERQSDILPEAGLKTRWANINRLQQRHMGLPKPIATLLQAFSGERTPCPA